ncbi:Inhibitor of growth protein, partial [Gryllus bimaculatus]
MLYLEDYLEMIEHLPQALRDRFTEMREMDLSVQNSMDSLEKRVKTFFANAKKMKPVEKEAEYESIRKDYYKTLEDADEKVHLANQTYDLVDRYLRRLDQELHKFKIELEANNKGITDVLQKRSLELDQPQANSSQKENRFNFNSTRASHHEKRRDSNSSAVGAEKRLAVEKACSSLPEPRPAAATVTSGSVSNPTALSPAAVTPSNVNYNLAHIGAGGNAIAAAASQAIAATQQ